MMTTSVHQRAPISPGLAGSNHRPSGSILRVSSSPGTKKSSPPGRSPNDPLVRWSDHEKVSPILAPKKEETKDETDATVEESQRDGVDQTSQQMVEKTNKWHDCIEIKDWDRLESLLKKYDRNYYKRKQEQAEMKVEAEKKAALEAAARANGEAGESKEPCTPILTPRRVGLKMLKLLPQSISARLVVDPSEVISPLLQVDELGRTPLHLACLHKAPEKLLLELARAEKKAASVRDRNGQMPLHLAVQRGLHDHVMDKIIKAHPNALKTKDSQGRTPVGFAVELARQKQEEKSPEDSENPFHWSDPISNEEKNWQFAQFKIWARVEFLLKDLMKRNKCVIPSEHSLLLEALEGGAPPKTINRFISTSDKYLMNDAELAGSAISLCIDRQYCLDTLEYLLENCRENTTMIVDYTHKTLTSHYRRGCYPVSPGMVPFGKEVIDWCKSNPDWKSKAVAGADDAEEVDEDERSLNDAMVWNQGGEDEEDETGIHEKETEEEKFLAGASLVCKDWWEKLRHLLFYCAYGKNFSSNKAVEDYHLLHAALAISAVQPSLIQLLLVVYPEAQGKICPSFNAMPIHLACTRWRYDILRNDKDSSLQKVMKQFLKSDHDQIALRHQGRLPLHLALAVGQSWTFVKPLVQMDPKSVGMRDPSSRLFPFQLAAVKFPSKNVAMLLRNRYTPSEWRITSKKDKEEEYKRAQSILETRQIGTIFELLKRHPDAILGKVILRGPSKIMGISGAGPLSTHYLNWVYSLSSTGWTLNPVNTKLLRDSILSGRVLNPLVPWFEKLKTLIWQTTPADSILQIDDYLLHAALYNADTPPLVIELLLELFPLSASTPLPDSQIYPLHIAAGTRSYRPQPFEIRYSMENMHLTLQAYKRAVRLRHLGRLPLHICIDKGKTWKEIRPLVQEDKKSLLAIDPMTGLAPFQLMAIFNSTHSRECSLRYAAIAEKQIQHIDMDQKTAAERAQILKDIKKTHELSVLSTVYELLRHAPSAIKSQRLLGDVSDGMSSVVSSILSEEESWSQSHRGMASQLDRFIQGQRTPSLLSPERKPKKSLSAWLREQEGPPLVTPVPSSSPERKSKKSLSAFLRDQEGPYLITPIPSAASGRPSLSNYLSGGTGNTSMRSLISRNSPIYGDYAKPKYDDDNMSSMGASSSSASIWLSPHVGEDGSVRFTPGADKSSTPKTPRRRLKKLPAPIPDLG